MLEGRVTEFYGTNGIGTIEDCNRNKFVLDTNKGRSGISVSEIKTGDRVRFEKGSPSRLGHPFAINVQVIETQEAEEAATEPKPVDVVPERTYEQQDIKKVKISDYNRIIKPPYHFVPVPSSLEGRIFDTPILHHGNNQGQADLISGELRCTLTALTPLLVGNDQYPVTEVKGFRDIGREMVEIPWKQGGRNTLRVHKEKKVLEPLRLKDKNGRVLISGASLKGMLRQSLGALLGAPMERVGEGIYSYRPNLYRSQNGLIIGLAAIVVKKPDVDGNGMDVKLCWPPRGVRKPSFSTTEAKQPPPREYRYLGGLDGCGRKRSAELQGDWRTEIQHVPQQVVLWYWESIKILPDLQMERLKDLTPFKAGDLVFVEWDKEKKCITSIGHNYQYRVRYADTVRKKWKGWTDNPQAPFITETRASLSPLAQETEHLEDGCPRQLSGVRLLMGYVRDKDSGTKDIGGGDFERLAGRIAFNMAVENLSHQDEIAESNRFLNSISSCCVPLKELGSPKPSAVEFYLKQKKSGTRAPRAGGLLDTYGDLPGVEPFGEELNGRKFYLHQPDAADPSSQTCFEDQSQEGRANKRAVLARFVSKPGTEFRFTLRFRDLRLWELGAVLVALNPEYVQRIKDLPETIRTYLDCLNDLDGSPECFALKMGHGRPLGMGSVFVDINEDWVWQDDDLCRKEGSEKKELETAAVRAFWDKCCSIDTGILLQWLKVHQYRGRTRSDYPRGEDGEIFGFHTGLRRAHAEARRFKSNTAHPESLQPLTCITASGQEI